MRDNADTLSSLLAAHHEAHSSKYYYAMRSKKPEDPIERAAWFIYLNRTCWNGLYRVNLQNEFNVPIGTKNQVVMKIDDFSSIAKLLSSANINEMDFENSIDQAGEKDFVFVDPPYTVNHNFNGFLKYNDHRFSWNDQLRLRAAVSRAASRGAMVLVTNANHQSVRDLYRGLGERRVLTRASVLAGSASHRVRTEELAVRTWVIPEDQPIDCERIDREALEPHVNCRLS